MTKPIKTLRKTGEYAYTVSPECVTTTPVPNRYALDIPYYYLCGLSDITGYANPVKASQAGRADAVPYVSLI
jgi:hypothetical protein